MKTRIHSLLLPFLFVVNSLSAQNVSTGLDASYAPLTSGGIDAHWSITAGPMGIRPAYYEQYMMGYWQPTPVSGTGACYIDPVGTWGQAAAGYYTFETSFTVNNSEASFLADFGIGCDDEVISAELIPPTGPAIPLTVTSATPSGYWVGPSVNYTVSSPMAGTWKIRVLVRYVDAIGGLIVSGQVLHTLPCDILTLTAIPSACDENNNYNLTGTVSYEGNPETGTLTVIANNGSSSYTQTFSPPFTDNQVYNISIPNIPADGAVTTVTATFSGETSCTQAVTYTAPFCVTPPCDILTLAAAPTVCDASYHFTVDGTLSYVNNPGTGTLTVTVNNAGTAYTQTFSPPFTDNQVYNFSIPNIPGNGAYSSVTAAFSDDASCKQTVFFTAPMCICTILSGTYELSDCGIDSSFSFSGHLTFAASPSSGTLTVAITTASGVYTQLFDAPFSDKVPLSFSIPGILADHAPASATAIFSDNTDCYYNFGSFTTPGCVCDTKADFQLSPQVITLPSTTAQMVNATHDGLAYYWRFGDGTTSTLENPHHTYFADSSGDYLVTLVAIGPGGCKDSISRYVSIKDQLIFYVPNAFTPDGDEFNQLFFPVFVSDFDPYNFVMFIFDRWGEVIFETHDASVGWDGTYNGSLVQNGTYAWKIAYKALENDSRQEASGHVDVLR